MDALSVLSQREESGGVGGVREGGANLRVEEDHGHGLLGPAGAHSQLLPVAFVRLGAVH